MIKRYFIPHLFNANPEWKNYKAFSKNTTVTNTQPFYPRDYDLIFVEKGYVKTFCNTNYKKEIFTLIIGENSLANVGGTITGANRFSKLITDTKAEIRIYDSYYFWDLSFIQDNPHLMQGLAKTISKCIEIHTTRSHYSCFFECLPRLCNTILDITTDKQIQYQQYIKSINQIELSQLCGMHPVTTCNILKKLRQNNIIGKVTPQYIEILDQETLINISNSTIEL